jgi:hypothetical protein
MPIKELLEALSKGEKTIDEVVTAINKDTVPYSRFSEKVQEVKTLKTDLQERDTQLETLKNDAGDNQKLKDNIAALQKANDEAKTAYEQQIAGLKLEAALDTTLLTAKARNPKAVKALLDMDTIKLDGDNVLGLSEQLEKLQESDGYLFDIADNNQQQQQQQQQKQGAYGTGLTGRGNQPPPPPNAFEAGQKRALERHAARLSKEEN